jgi:hypothetical protein
MFRICLAVRSLLIFAALLAQAKSAAAVCPHIITAGKSSSNAYISGCVTDHGDLSSIETPFGHFHLGAQGDGYGFCQESPATEYHDYLAGESGNWNAPKLLGANGSTVKLSRSTADGNWTLVQTISAKVTGIASIKIVMALTNNQSEERVAYIMRYADVDADGHRNHDYIGGASLQSAYVWSLDSGFHYGLQLQNAGNWTGYQQGFVSNATPAPNACDFANPAQLYGYELAFSLGSDSSIRYAYAGPVPSHKTITVTLSYHGL